MVSLGLTTTLFIMKPKFIISLFLAIEEGVRYGYNRAHKHIDNPQESVIVDNIVEQVMSSLDEWFDFEDEE